MSANRDKAYRAVDSELDYQEELVKLNNYTNPKSIGEYLTLARVYLHKAEDAWTQEPDTEDDLNSLHGLRKVAGIAIACLIAHGAPHRTEKAKRKTTPAEFKQMVEELSKLNDSIGQSTKALKLHMGNFEI